VTAEVVRFRGITKLDLEPSVVLEFARNAGLTEVVVVGFDADGDEYFCASQADGAQVLWHLQRAAHKLLTMPEAPTAALEVYCAKPDVTGKVIAIERPVEWWGS
jgi:hypothetical protein